MARGAQATAPRQPAARRNAIEAAEISAERRRRLEQADLLRDARMRALWPTLTQQQQTLVLDPRPKVEHRYPLSSGETADLTGLSERQVRYWADRGLIAHWRKGKRRMFEAVGLITALSIANAGQHELRFYRGIMEEPVDELLAKVGILASLFASRLESIEPGEGNQLTAPLREIARR